MSDWVDEEADPPRAAQWLHVPTGVELFVAPDGDGYGVRIRATEASRVDHVSIGDPETGQFERFDDAAEAVEWADHWKDEVEDLDALLPPEEERAARTDGSEK